MRGRRSSKAPQKRQRKDVQKRRPRTSNLEKVAVAAEHYRQLKECGIKTSTYKMEAQFGVPASTVRDYYNNYLRTGEPIHVPHQGKPATLHPTDEAKIAAHAKRCCDLGFGKTTE